MKATTKAKAAPKSAPKANKTFSAEERAAMQDAAREAKARSKGKVDGEAEIRAKIAELKGDDKAMAERVHAIVRKAAPGLEPRTWYGMPAYADQTGKAVVFFQPAGKFKARYATLGFNDSAQLDDGAMWPTAYALTRLTAADEAKIAALVKKAAG